MRTDHGVWKDRPRARFGGCAPPRGEATPEGVVLPDLSQELQWLPAKTRSSRLVVRSPLQSRAGRTVRTERPTRAPRASRRPAPAPPRWYGLYLRVRPDRATPVCAARRAS